MYIYVYVLYIYINIDGLYILYGSHNILPLATVKSFALDLMPSFVERVNGPEDFEKFKNKAKKFGLPMMLFFSEDRRISNEMKYLSVEFRKRVLIAQIPFTKKENKNIFFEYGVRGNALIVVPPSNVDEGGEGEGNQHQSEVVFDGKWSLHRLQSFFKEHALEKEVQPTKPAEDKSKVDEKKGEEEKKKVKTEL